METIYKRGVRFTASVLTVASLLLLNACQDHNIPTPGAGLRFYALNATNQLFEFTTQNTATAISTISVTGLQPDDDLLGIDFRPATSQLYGVGNSNRLYVINPSTGVARALGAGPFTPPLNINEVGFDFNPTVDRIRLVTSLRQNLRLNPETGTTMIVDGSIVGSANIGAVAYTNSRAGATSTVLYDIDLATTSRLYRQDPLTMGRWSR